MLLKRQIVVQFLWTLGVVFLNMIIIWVLIWKVAFFNLLCGLFHITTGVSLPAFVYVWILIAEIVFTSAGVTWSSQRGNSWNWFRGIPTFERESPLTKKQARLCNFTSGVQMYLNCPRIRLAGTARLTVKKWPVSTISNREAETYKLLESKLPATQNQISVTNWPVHWVSKGGFCL